MAESFYQIAVVVGAHGLKGEVKIRFFGTDPALLKNYGCLWLDEVRSLTLTKVRPIKPGFLIAQFEGVDTRDQAESLLKAALHIKETQLLPLEDANTFYHQHLIGCEVLAGEERLGFVKTVDNYGGDDVLELGKMRILFRKESVLQVDRAARKIWVNPELVIRDTV